MSAIEGQDDKSNTDILNSVQSSMIGQEDKSNDHLVQKKI